MQSRITRTDLEPVPAFEFFGATKIALIYSSGQGFFYVTGVPTPGAKWERGQAAPRENISGMCRLQNSDKMVLYI